MDELNSWIIIGIPTVVAAAIGAIRSTVREVKEELKRQEGCAEYNGMTKMQRIDKAFDADPANITWNVIFGVVFGAVIGLAISGVVYGAMWWATNIHGANEGTQKFRRMKKAHSSMLIPEEQKETAPVRVASRQATSINKDKYRQWQVLERGRNSVKRQVQVRALGRQQVRLRARVA